MYRLASEAGWLRIYSIRDQIHRTGKKDLVFMVMVLHQQINHQTIRTEISWWVRVKA